MRKTICSVTIDTPITWLIWSSIGRPTSMSTENRTPFGSFCTTVITCGNKFMVRSPKTICSRNGPQTWSSTLFCPYGRIGCAFQTHRSTVETTITTSIRQTSHYSSIMTSYSTIDESMRGGLSKSITKREGCHGRSPHMASVKAVGSLKYFPMSSLRSTYQY